MATVSELEVVLRGDDSDLNRSMDNADNRVKDFASNANKKLGELAKNVATWGLAMGLALGGAALTASTEWEVAFTDVTKMVDGTDEQLQELEDTLFDLSTSGATGALEDAAFQMAEIAAAAGSLGIATENIEDFTETVAVMSVATGMGAEELATWAARFANVTGMDMSNLQNLSDTLVTLENNMAATSEEITSFSGRMANLATFGFEPQEILAYSAAMSSLGLTAELGSTNLVKSVSDMTSAVAENGDTLSIWAETAGMSRDAFTALAQTDGDGAFQAFLDGLNDLPVDEQLRRLNDLGITSQEQQRTIMTLASGYDTLTDAIDYANDGWAGNNAAMQEAERMADTTQGKVNLLGNKMFELSVNLGKVLDAGFNDVLDGLLKMTEGDAGGIEAIGAGIVQMAEDLAEAAGFDVTWVDDFEAGVAVIHQLQDLFQGTGPLAQAMGRIIKETWLNMQLDFFEFIKGWRDKILEISGGNWDIAPEIQVSIDNVQAQLNTIGWADEITADLQAQMATGDLQLDAIQLDVVGDAPDLNFEALTDPAQIAALAESFSVEGVQAVQDALAMAYETSDEAAVDVLVPLAVELGIDVQAVQNQAFMDIENALMEAYATGDQEGIDALLPVAVDLGIDTEAVRMQAEHGVITAIEGEKYPAIAYVDLVIVPSSIDDSAIAAATGGYRNVNTPNWNPSDPTNITVNSYGQSPYELIGQINGTMAGSGGR